MKVAGGLSLHLLGVKIRSAVPLRVIKSNTTSIRGVVVPYIALS